MNREFDVVFIPFNSFMELLGAENQARTLERIHHHLKLEGVFICTLHNPAQRLETVTGQFSVVGEHDLPDGGKLSVFSVERHHPESGLVKGVQYFEIYDGLGTLRQKRLLEIKFNLVQPESFERMIENAGFKVHELYGNYDRSGYDPDRSPFLIYFLKKSR